jgi:hypothetical protein
LREALVPFLTTGGLTTIGVVCWIFAAMSLGLMLGCLLLRQYIRATLLFCCFGAMGLFGAVAFAIALVPMLLASLP